MKHRVYRMLTSALCALALLLSLIPAACAADAPLHLKDIIGGDPNCAHDFDAFHPIIEQNNNCLEWHYEYWPCTKCGAKRVSKTIAPKLRHRFNIVTGLCIECGTPDPDPNASYPGREPATPTTPDTPADDPQPDLPTVPTSEKLYESGQVLGGILRCNHIFDNAHPINVPANCAGFGYLFWPCTRCNAYKVGTTYRPIGHRFNAKGVCTRCGASKPEDTPAVPTTPTTPGSAPTRNYDFGEYTGVIQTGEMEFVRYMNVGEKETQLPLVNTQGYDIKITSSAPNIVSVDGLTFQARAQGNAKLNYVFTGSGGDQVKVIVTVTVMASPSSAAGSDIKPNPDFGTYIGTNRDGVEEFKLTLTAGTKETGRPMTSTQNYRVNTWSTDPNVIAWDGLTILAKGAGTATLTYKYVIDGVEQTKAIVYATVVASPSAAAGSDIKPNPNFGTYIGANRDGVEEFKLTLTSGTKETKLPMTSTQNYRVNTWSTDPSVIAWDGLTILAKGAGTATLTYKYVIDGVEQTKAIVYATVEAGAETPAVGGSNGDAYSKRSGNLGPRPDGGCDLIWTSGVKTIGTGGKVVSDTRQTKITSYDKDFHEIAVHPINFELNTEYGAYWGEKYNFLVFGQDNQEQTDSKEVLRIVKFSKDWERLGAASIYGKSSNTSGVFGFCTMSFAESGDMLYVHTAHEMYRSPDGLQHQANMTFSIRQSDMTITDSRHGVEMGYYGYVSHSFAQDILVDQSGNLVTLDQGDAYPRAASLFRYGAKAGGNKFTGSKGTVAILKTWPGATGDNNTGSETCALAETSQGYLSAYLDSGKGGSFNWQTDVYNAYLAFNPKNNMSATQTKLIANGSRSEFLRRICLFPTSSEGGYLLWFTSDTPADALEQRSRAYYAMYSADGSFGQTVSLGDVPDPINGPYFEDGKIVWSGRAVTDKGMQFGILENGKLTVIKADGELAGKASTTTPTTPTTPTSPSNGKTPFTDVPAGAYYTDAVAWALENGVTAGTTATTFSPYSACTRGQVVTFLWRAKGEPEPVTRTNPFRDVKASDYYYKAVLWAYENGITAGTTATTFGPGDTCTNGHVVTFLWRTNGKPAASGTSALAGTFPKDFYTDAVAWADTSGLLKDTGAAFDPRNQSPRANIVTYLYRNQAGQTAQPSQTRQPASSTTPPAGGGEKISESAVLAAINGLKAEYPEGMRWTNDNSHFSAGVNMTGYGCAGFALICSDAAFGSLPVTETHSDFDRVRVGDMLRVSDDTHSVVVLEKRADSVIVAEGNFNSSIHWGREISRGELEKGSFSAQTRYPA